MTTPLKTTLLTRKKKHFTIFWPTAKWPKELMCLNFCTAGFWFSLAHKNKMWIEPKIFFIFPYMLPKVGLGCGAAFVKLFLVFECNYLYFSFWAGHACATKDCNFSLFPSSHRSTLARNTGELYIFWWFAEWMLEIQEMIEALGQARNVGNLTTNDLCVDLFVFCFIS